MLLDGDRRPQIFHAFDVRLLTESQGMLVVSRSSDWLNSNRYCYSEGRAGTGYNFPGFGTGALAPYCPLVSPPVDDGFPFLLEDI